MKIRTIKPNVAAISILAMSVAAVLLWTPDITSAQSTRPPAPTGIAVSVVDENTINVIWTAHPDGASDYRLAWTTQGSNFRSYTNTDWNAFPTGTSYTINGLEAGATYKIKVRARFNGGPASRWSSVVTATTPEQDGTGRSSHIDPPQNLRAYTRNASPHNPWRSVTVTWGNPSQFVQIVRTAPGLPQHTRTGTSTDEVTYTALHPSTTYTFNVRRGTSSTDLGPAGTVTVTTSGPPQPMGLRTKILQSDQITLAWTEDFNPETNLKTHVRRTPHGSNTPDYTEEYSGEVNQYAETRSFTSGDRYTYEVWYSVEADGTRYDGNKRSLDVTVPQDFEPQELTARPRNGTTSLNWVDPSDRTITRHRVERRRGATGPFSTVREQNAGATSFHDNFLDGRGDWKENTVYQYRVRLGDADSWGDYVEVDVITPELPQLVAPTNLQVVNASFTNNVYEANDGDPELSWEVPSEQDGGGVGAKVTRQLTDPPEGVTCQSPGNCPVMELYNTSGSRIGAYTDVWNGGGTYRYWVRFVGRDGTLGPQATILVQVPSPPVPPHVAPSNVRFTAGANAGLARFNVFWNAAGNQPGYLVQWRRSDQQYNADETGGRSILDVASNRLNMWEADGRSHRPAGTGASWSIQRDATPNPWNTTYYVRVGTCKTRDCEIAEVVFAPEVSASQGANPYN